jgi:DNA-binding beta-propeller fold protein YncE
MATVPVGIDPFGVAANPATNTIYVTNSDNSGTVSVISGRARW